METLKRTATLRAAVAAARSEGRGPIALVPTMGNLHDGHLALLSAARKQAGTVVASIFVNPLQFGAGDDFDRYPRTLARDQALLTEAGVDLLFAPDEQQMYPHGRAITQVIVKQLSEVLCGASRPGHFAGVTTVVAMLLHMVAPDIAVFGAKDYQQLVLIRRMVADLHFPVEIAGVSTVRATDGLALSSRNQYLDADERVRAPALYRALCAAAQAVTAGDRDYERIEAEGQRRLDAAGFQVDYFAVRTEELRLPCPDDQQLRILAAARLGAARLIDNLTVEAVAASRG